MIKYFKHTLKNGLRVILSPFKKSNIAVVNIMYNIGSRDEEEDHTGFAHLFEHLMFGGSKNIKNFDTELQKVGGINNAYTSSDLTNYFSLLPSENLETALWLESDRMLELSFDPKVLSVQKKVVIEEFKEHYHNPPYGELWPSLCSLSYKKHPYKWPTIGKALSHIKKANLDYVKNFFYNHYAPNNAIISITGGIDIDKTIKLVEKYFSSIDRRDILKRNLVKEPLQTKPRKKVLHKEVPLEAIYKTFQVSKRNSKEFYAYELLADILSTGKSSLFYKNLIRDRNIFASIDAHTTDTFDEGLMIVGGKINDGITIEDAEKELDDIIFNLNCIKEEDLTKAKNQTQLHIETNNLELSNIAHDLCYYELLGDIELINNEKNKYEEIDLNYLLKVSKKSILANKQNKLYFTKKN